MNSKNQTSNENKKVVNRLIRHLKSGEAFKPVDGLLKQMPYEKTGVKVDSVPYTVYELVYHLRFAQLDIITYCQDSDYEAPEWPTDYWPGDSAPKSKKEWQKLVDHFINEREQFCEYIETSSSLLLKEVKEGTGHTLLRQILLLVEHNAYHIGQLNVLKRLLK